jgi:hypothetical protein
MDSPDHGTRLIRVGFTARAAPQVGAARSCDSIPGCKTDADASRRPAVAHAARSGDRPQLSTRRTGKRLKHRRSSGQTGRTQPSMHVTGSCRKYGPEQSADRSTFHGQAPNCQMNGEVGRSTRGVCRPTVYSRLPGRPIAGRPSMSIIVAVDGVASPVSTGRAGRRANPQGSREALGGRGWTEGKPRRASTGVQDVSLLDRPKSTLIAHRALLRPGKQCRPAHRRRSCPSEAEVARFPEVSSRRRDSNPGHPELTEGAVRRNATR